MLTNIDMELPARGELVKELLGNAEDWNPRVQPPLPRLATRSTQYRR